MPLTIKRRLLTKTPPLSFRHRDLFWALNSAINNKVPADLKESDTDGMAMYADHVRSDEGDLASQRRNGHPKLQAEQYGEDFNLYQTWTAPTATGVTNLANSITLNDNDVVDPNTSFIPRLSTLRATIQEKKQTNPLFNDLFYAELYFAAMSLASLVKDNTTSSPQILSGAEHPMPKEMELLTDILGLTNRVLENPLQEQLMVDAFHLQLRIEQYINDSENNPLELKIRNIEFWLSVCSGVTWTVSSLGVVTALGVVAALAMSSSPVIVLSLLGAAIGFVIVAPLSLWMSFRVEDKIGKNLRDMKDFQYKTMERAGVILKFLQDVEDLIDVEPQMIPQEQPAL